MGVDSRGINRGGCNYSGCLCIDFQSTFGTNKCLCSHPPANHTACGTDIGGKGSHVTTPSTSGWHSNQESHHHQPHHHGHPSVEATGGASGWNTCLTCHTGYSSVDVGACSNCCGREACKSGCGKPAFFTLELGSFGYCSAECRDRCELEGAKRELTRALGEFEVNPGRGSTETPAKGLVNYDPTLQPQTRARLQREDTPTTTPTTLGGTRGAPPTQQPTPPQKPTSSTLLSEDTPAQASVNLHCCKLSLEAACAISFYESGKLQTMSGTKGLLVTSINVNKATLDCDVQPLDLITQLDGTPAEYLCDPFGRCIVLSTKMKNSANVWITRRSGIPSISLLQRIEELPVQQSGRKHRIVGFLVTQKDLVDPASYLGVRMCKYSNGKKVDYVNFTSEGVKGGLHRYDIIQSVTMVTAEGVVGPETEWTFESIKKHARESPSVSALLLTVAKD